MRQTVGQNSRGNASRYLRERAVIVSRASIPSRILTCLLFSRRIGSCILLCPTIKRKNQNIRTDIIMRTV